MFVCVPMWVLVGRPPCMSVSQLMLIESVDGRSQLAGKKSALSFQLTQPTALDISHTPPHPPPHTYICVHTIHRNTKQTIMKLSLLLAAALAASTAQAFLLPFSKAPSSSISSTPLTRRHATVTVGPASEIPNGERKVVDTEAGAVVVANVGGEFYAVNAKVCCVCGWSSRWGFGPVRGCGVWTDWPSPSVLFSPSTHTHTVPAPRPPHEARYVLHHSINARAWFRCIYSTGSPWLTTTTNARTHARRRHRGAGRGAHHHLQLSQGSVWGIVCCALSGVRFICLIEGAWRP